MTALRPWARPVVWVWAALLALLGLALVAQPFIGFLRVVGYELALVLSLFVSVATIHVGAALVVARRTAIRSPVEAPLGRAEAVLHPWLAATGTGVALSAVPLVIALAGAVFVRNCDIPGGLLLWLAFPIAAAPLAAVAGVWAGLVAPTRFPRLFPAAAGVTVVLSSALWELGRFYFTPIVFFYDPFGGFVSGQGWDRALTIGAPFLWYRVYDAAAFGAALLAALALVEPRRLRPARPARGSWPLLAAAAAAAAVAVALDANGGALGFRPTSAYSAGRLGGEIVTEHVVLRYDRTAHHDEAPLLASDLEYRWDQLLAFYGGRAPRHRIVVWLYGSGDQKRTLFGTANTDMAKPWRDEVHLGPAKFPHPVAMHEMAHVFAGAMAGGPFDVPSDLVFNVSMGLVEGVAMAAEFDADAASNELTSHEWSAAMRAAGFAPAIPDLVRAEGFLSSNPGTSYTVAGSFVRFLVDTYGMDRFAGVYGGASFAEAYGKDITGLAAEWGAFVDAIRLAPWASDVARFRFDRPSILRAVCYHEIPKLSGEAARMAKEGDVDRAVATWRKICEWEPDDPGHRMTIFRAFVAAERFADARAEAEALRAHPKLGAVRALELTEELGDLAWRSDDRAGAAAAYENAALAHRSEGADRRLAVKRAALGAAPEVGDRVRDYLLADDKRSPALTILLLKEATDRAPDFAPAHYLVGFRLSSLAEHARAIPYFEKALALGLPHPALTREARWRLGEAYFRTGKLDDAATVFRALDAGGEPEAVRRTARDWLGRIDWWKRNPARACALPLAAPKGAAP